MEMGAGSWRGAEVYLELRNSGRRSVVRVDLSTMRSQNLACGKEEATESRLLT
jgi:hypothetical protein